MTRFVRGFLRLAAVLLLVAALASPVPAETVREETFSSLGFADFSVNGANKVDCTRAFFQASPSDLPAGTIRIASLHVVLLPVAERFDLNVFLNRGETPLAVFNEKNLAGEWARVEIPPAGLKQKNELAVCARTSFAVTRLIVRGDSILGVYRAPDFPAANGFTMTPSDSAPQAGDEFAVTVKARNHGGADAVVDFSYRRPALEGKQPEIVVLKGATEAKGATVPKCRAFDETGACVSPGEREFRYWVKAAEATKISLLPAVLTYANAFGETETLESNRPAIEVLAPKIKIKPLILSDKEIVKVDELYRGRVALKNTSLTGVKNVKVTLKVDPGLTLEGNDAKEFEFIPAQGTAYLEVRVRADAPGNYALGCEAVYQETRLRFAECDTVNVNVEQDDVSMPLLVALGLVVVAALAYVYINRS